jgi:uncharacterized membrane protein
MMVLWQIAGVVLAGAGVGALYLAWQRKQRSWPLVSAGWVLLLGSIMAWGKTSGVDKGPALGIIFAIIIAMIAVVIAGLRTPLKQRREPRTRATGSATLAATRSAALAQTATIAVILLAGLAVSLAACTALFMTARTLGLEHTANLTLTMFSFPLVWAGLVTSFGYVHGVRTRATLLSCFLAISVAIILATMKAI